MRSARPPEVAADAAVDPLLKVKLVWLTVFRTVAAMLLLGVVAVRLLSRRPVEELGAEDSVTFAVIGVVFFVNVLYGLWLRRADVGPRAAWVQVLGDVILATGLVYLTGGADSPFTFVYSVAIIAGAIILYQRGAIVAAAASASFFVALLLLVQAGWLRPPLGAYTLSPGRLGLVIATNVLAQVLIAVLASYLTHQLRLAGRQLFAREVEVEQLERLQRQIMASMPSGLITCNAEGAVTFMNRAALLILGLEEVPRGRPVEQVMPGVLGVARSRREELRVERGGRELTLGLTVVPLDSPEGGLLLVFQDLTELRRTEAMLRRTDRLAELGTMAAQLAHEIRNPLAAMRGAAQMLSKDGVDPQSNATLTTILIRETDRLSVLLRDFLQFARPNAPQRREVDLKDVVEQILQMARVDPLAASARIEVDAAPVRAFIDPDQIRQVLLNVVRNGLAAAGAGGRMEISARAERGSAIIRIWDSAGSIPPENLGRIFHPFFTTRDGGTGLGLSTAHAIINAHGGTIDVSSSPAEGTEFVITLPQEPEAPHADPGR